MASGGKDPLPPGKSNGYRDLGTVSEAAKGNGYRGLPAVAPVTGFAVVGNQADESPSNGNHCANISPPSPRSSPRRGLSTQSIGWSYMAIVGIGPVGGGGFAPFHVPNSHSRPRVGSRSGRSARMGNDSGQCMPCYFHGNGRHLLRPVPPLA